MSKADQILYSTLLALVLMFLGAWYLSFGSRMMRSKDLNSFKKALRVTIFSVGMYWAVGIAALLNPRMSYFTRQMSATLAMAIGLLLIFRRVQDVPTVKKVMIWFVWSALSICTVILYAKLYGI